jgi:uncharacterized repeat protein (TIGR03803 family)
MHNSYVGLSLLLILLSPCATFSQSVREVFSFSNANSSAGPVGSPVQGRNSKLYGETSGLGRTIVTNGAVFDLSTTGIWSLLHTFGGTDGENPQAGLTLAADGNYYGAATYDKNTGWGVLFRIAPNGIYTILHQFTGGSDGGHPFASLIQAADGNLYGTTYPGLLDDGTVYKLVPSTGVFSTIFSLNSDGSQGQQISSPPLQGVDRNFYMTASLGGANGCGTIFKLATTGALLQVYSFPCGVGGNLPIGALIQASDGSLYGTTQWGGNVTSQGECQSGCGTVFKMSQGVVSVVYSFAGAPNDGAFSLAGLVQGTDGNLYGGTDKGGINDLGTLFEITSNGQYKLLYSFVDKIGSGANGPLLQHTNGKFYGYASFGGGYSEGALYSLDMGLGPFVALVRYTGRIGQPVQILGQGLTGSTAVTINGVAATTFKVVSDTYMTATIPTGATSGPVVVTTPKGTLTSNHNLRIVQ